MPTADLSDWCPRVNPLDTDGYHGLTLRME
jgi:hypothetical protein